MTLANSLVLVGFLLLTACALGGCDGPPEFEPSARNTVQDADLHSRDRPMSADTTTLDRLIIFQGIPDPERYYVDLPGLDSLFESNRSLLDSELYEVYLNRKNVLPRSERLTLVAFLHLIGRPEYLAAEWCEELRQLPESQRLLVLRDIENFGIEFSPESECVE